ncbi:MAG TPA: DUF58 domain-containing protein [Saprospiraceae bacterium]|nr:DUF58 domain-containing protein [Saprospiraceae bacterium]HMQ85429.1 DUF58 domain-containing protein [Saprospiraceae bacterium]
MIRQLYLPNRFFQLFGVIVVLFAVSFWVKPIFPFIQALLVLAFSVVVLDGLLLFHKSVQLNVERRFPKLFNLGDPNEVEIYLENQSRLMLRILLIDELPYQFQIRDFNRIVPLKAGEEKIIRYELRPVERGEYLFGNINLFLSSSLGLLERRYVIEQPCAVAVYPSILQMKQFELKAFNRVTHHKGIKKIRRIGHSYEFEQIKNYVRGDDYRSINWKASSRRAALMVNQFQDERAQQIYCIIDKSRAMRMPFEGLSLMDYAVNTALVISNIALQKYDRAGLISFSDKLGSSIKADNKPTQLNKLLSTLYKEKEQHLEANYELLYYAARKLISGRSLIMLFTNFESRHALERVLPILRRINTFHLLVVVFFENTEIRDFVNEEAESLEAIYHQTIARKFLNEKAQMVHQLQQYGIQSILTRPEDLSTYTVNKYLELKSRGLI